MAAIASVLISTACHQDREPLRRTIFVPAGQFRARPLCGYWFERACELSKEPPLGMGRRRVLMWLDAFWADSDLVPRTAYDACRAAGACEAPQIAPASSSCLDSLASVPFEGAVSYCRWRGWRLPTPDEFERMARWTDGRQFATGRPFEPWPPCERRPSPDGIRSLNLNGQWVANGDHAVLMGGSTATRFNEVDGFGYTAPFRCVRSAYPTADPGRAKVADDQSDPWLRGGPL